MRRLFLPIVVLAIAVVVAYATGGLGVAGGMADSATPPNVRQILSAVALWLVAAWLCKRVFEALLKRTYVLRGDDGDPPRLLGEIFGVVIFVAAGIAVVAVVFDQSITGLLTTSGLLVGIVAFAVRDTIADIFAGIALNIERPFRPGDWLKVEEADRDEIGKVVDINWRATHLVTNQGRTIVIPNAILASRRFVNFNTPARHFRAVRQIVVDYSVPPERVVNILMAAIKATDGVVQSQRPVIHIDNCLDRGILYSLNFWVPDYPQLLDLEREVVINALNHLNQAGIAPAYPKRELDPTWRHERAIARDIDPEALLRRVPLFAALSEEELAMLSTNLKTVDYGGGAEVIREGAEGESLFVVAVGLLSVTAAGDGGRTEIGRLGPGEFFGEMSLLTGTPRSAFVTAVTPVTLLEIRKQDLEPILSSNPHIIEKLSEIQAHRLSGREALRKASQMERDQIENVGLKNFLQGRICRFFGVSLAPPDRAAR